MNNKTLKLTWSNTRKDRVIYSKSLPEKMNRHEIDAIAIEIRDALQMDYGHVNHKQFMEV